MRECDFLSAHRRGNETDNAAHAVAFVAGPVTESEVRNAATTCNLFQPGVQPGKHPEFVNFGKGTPAYNTDVDNLADGMKVTVQKGEALPASDTKEGRGKTGSAGSSAGATE